MTIDKSKIEEFAVRAVEDMVDSCDRLKSHLSVNDKTPSWDGTIYVYEDCDTSRKSKFNAKIDVQIKGQSYKGSLDNLERRTTTKFQISIEDLHNYAAIHGTMVFVVCVKDEKRKIFCKSLLPLDLYKIIHESGTKKTRKLTFHEVKDSNELEKICTRFCLEFNKQIQIPPQLFGREAFEKAAQKYKKIELLVQEGDEAVSSMWNLVDKTGNGYVVNDDGAYAGVEKVYISSVTVDDPDAIIYSGNIDSGLRGIKIIQRKESTEIVFGDAFSINSLDQKIHFHVQGSLSDRIKQAEFIEMIVNGEMVYMRTRHAGTGLQPLCKVDSTAEDAKRKALNMATSYSMISRFLKGWGISGATLNETWSDKECAELKKFAEVALGDEPLLEIPGLGGETQCAILRVGKLRLAVLANRQYDKVYKIMSLGDSTLDEIQFRVTMEDQKVFHLRSRFLVASPLCYISDNIDHIKVEQNVRLLGEAQLEGYERTILCRQISLTHEAYETTGDKRLLDYMKCLCDVLDHH